MTIEEFKKYNKKYRMVCEFDENLECKNKESFFIPCFNNRAMLYYVNDNEICIDSFISPTSYLEKYKKEKIKYDLFGMNGEYSITFNPKYLDKALEISDCKKQAQKPLPPNSNRNITTFLRVMQNIHPRYKTILQNYISKNKE